MDLRTAVLTVVLLGIGYAVGALTTSAGETSPPATGVSGDGPGVARTPEPGLDGRAVPAVAASSDDVLAALARIEKLLVANPMAAGASDEKIVERITEVWRPVLINAIETHQTMRARTRLITLYEQKISDYEAAKEESDPRGPAFRSRVEDLEKSIRDWQSRVEAFKAARTAAEIVEALVANPDAHGHHERGDALMIVYGDKHPD